MCTLRETESRICRIRVLCQLPRKSCTLHSGKYEAKIKAASGRFQSVKFCEELFEARRNCPGNPGRPGCGWPLICIDFGTDDMLAGSKLNGEYLRAYSRWLNALEYSEHAQHFYTKTAEQFCDLLGNREVDNATHWDVRHFLIRKIEQNQHYRVPYEALTALHNFFEFLQLGGVTASIPTHPVRVRTPQTRLPLVASPGLISRLIAVAKEPRERVLIEVLYATGCRISEVARIKVEDIDFESRKIRIDGKYNKSRYVVFGTNASRAMRTYLAGRNSGYLFRWKWEQKGSVYKASSGNRWIGEVSIYTSRRASLPRRKRLTMRLGCRSEVSFDQAWSIFKKRISGLDLGYPVQLRPMATRSLRMIVYQLALRAGIRRITPKEFRHCCATHLLDGGADIREIQELLGHSCLTSTQIYTHIGRKRLLQVFDRCHPRGNHYDAKNYS